MRIQMFIPTLIILLTCWSIAVDGGQAPPKVTGRLNNLKVLSSAIDDVTTPENFLRSFIIPGMSDEERSKAIWTGAVRYRHQTVPPNEYISDEWEAHDPIKLFNVYGYCMCCCCSAIIESLNRLDGRETRGRILNAHSVPEVKYSDKWHMYDCSLITFFPKSGSVDAAAVDDISAAVKEWYMQNPQCHGNPSKLIDLMRSDGWTGWKAKGPKLLSGCPYYNLGFLPARTHGWDATMQEYDRKSEVYEYGYQLGYRALFSLRPGESFVREAGNHGLHVNMDKDPKWDGLKAKAPEADLVYVKQFLPGYNGGVVGNGYHRYAPDLASGGLAAGAEVYQNLEAGGLPALHLRTSGKPGVVVFQMASPYVYLGGRVKLRAFRGTEADQVTVSLSTNNARTFAPIWQAKATGPTDTTIELKDRILRRYAYWVKIELQSATPHGVGLNSLCVENDIQHAPRTLPWLVKGSNKITVAADNGTAESTRTISCRISSDRAFTRNETTGTMGVRFENLDVKDGACWWKGGVGSMTVPIETPGDLSAIRFGAHIRARSEKDTIKMLLSFDDGNNWTEAAKVSGPTPGTTQYYRYANIPSGKHKALLKYELSGTNTVGIFSFRVDADYLDQLAVGSLRPFTVTHRWREGGMEKTVRTMISRLPFTYEIKTSAEPEMDSVTYEMGSK